MKIFHFNGSLRNNSSTKKLTDIFLKKLYLSTNEQIELIYYDYSTRIDTCLGCRNCFSGERCPLYIKDNFNNIISNMVSSDIIIFSSPVYLNNISSSMKIFLDRIAFLTHFMALAGKRGVVISTADSTGIEIVNAYLKQIQTNLGLKVVGSLGVKSYLLNGENNKLNSSIENLSSCLLNSLQNNDELINDIELNRLFLYYREYFKNPKSIAFKKEKEFWIKNNLINCENFNELIKLYKNINLQNFAK